MENAQAVHRIVRINYPIRAGSFAYSFLVIGLYGWERGLSGLFWLALSLTFLVYPHLVYHYTSRSSRPKNAEMRCMYVDAALLGAWSAALQFPIWITYATFFSTSLNAISLGGIPGGLWSIGGYCVGAALALAGFGMGHAPETSALVTALCFAGSVVYTCAIGYVMYEQNRGILAARAGQRESEERYRIIAENAAELIALVDRDGRWLYVSPSYGRILEHADLEQGVDAFRRVHPDDADRARIAVRRTASSGKGQDLALRLVDRDGRIRQINGRLQPVGNGAAPNTLVLVANDVTDVRESEERLLLAAHALEGMTEAIAITAADGTVVTVNSAFTEVTGYSRDEVLGNSEKAIRNALQPPEFYDELYAIVRRDGYWSGTTWSRRKSGSVYREWRSIRAVRDQAGATTHYVMVFYEVGASRNREEGSLKA